ncbi:MAG: hypothetical protein O9345_24165, partial [Burkholderiaceae bacterium]|nr:hypothetical protein [Burkholderiaceae bacterium]
DDEGIDLLLTELVRHAMVLAPGRGAAAPDPGDQLLWDLLASRADLVLVTGDRALLEDATMAGRVMSPVAFLSR